MSNPKTCSKFHVPQGRNKDIDCDTIIMSQNCPDYVPLHPVTHMGIDSNEIKNAGTFLSNMSSEHYGTHLSLFIERVSRVAIQKLSFCRFVARCSIHE